MFYLLPLIETHAFHICHNRKNYVKQLKWCILPTYKLIGAHAMKKNVM